MTDPIDLDALETAAKAATPGPWRRMDTSTVCGIIAGELPEGRNFIKPCDNTKRICYTNRLAPGGDENLAHIAALNPAVALRLIAELRESKRLADKFFGRWERGENCPQCGGKGFLDGIGEACDCLAGTVAKIRITLLEERKTRQAVIDAAVRAEREACAKEAEMEMVEETGHEETGHEEDMVHNTTCLDIAYQIRARA